MTSWLSSSYIPRDPYHPLDLSKPPVEEDEYQLSDQDGFFGDFCLMCGERCKGGDAYCSANCQLDSLRASAASALTPTPFLSWASASSYFISPTPLPQAPYQSSHTGPFPVILISPNPLLSHFIFQASPQLPSTPDPSSSISSASSFSLSTSSSDLSSLASLSESSPTLIHPSHHSPSNPSQHDSSASRPPPSPSIKATLARPSLSPSIALSSSGTGGHAALALRQVLGISILGERSLTLDRPFKKTSLSLSSNNWFKSLVKRAKQSTQHRPLPRTSNSAPCPMARLG